MDGTATEAAEVVEGGSSAACACALDPERVVARVAEWVELRREHLVSQILGDGVVTSFYERRDDVRLRLETLIQAEGECCSFLDFGVVEEGDHLRVTVGYPAGAESILALVIPELEPGR